MNAVWDLRPPPPDPGGGHRRTADDDPVVAEARQLGQMKHNNTPIDTQSVSATPPGSKVVRRRAQTAHTTEELLQSYVGGTACDLLAPEPGPSVAFTVQSGPCTIEDGGRCVGRPSGYSDSEACTIVPTFSFHLATCPVFVTEANWDFLTIDGTDYDGTNCPVGVAVTAASSIRWDSDDSVASDGWEICAALTPEHFCDGCTAAGGCTGAAWTASAGCGTCIEGWSGELCAVGGAASLILWRTVAAGIFEHVHDLSPLLCRYLPELRCRRPVRQRRMDRCHRWLYLHQGLGRRALRPRRSRRAI